MKLATFIRHDGAPAVGIVDTGRDRILDLAAADARVHGRTEPAFATMLALIEAGEGALARARAVAARWPR